MAGSLRVSKPSDRSEREADVMARRVLAMSGPAPLGSTVAADDDVVSRCPGGCDCDEVIHRDGGDGHAHGAVSGSDVAGLGSGKPLSDSVRGFFEPRFGADLSQVRVHTGSQAGGLAARVGARAFTFHQDVVFRSGEFRPQSGEGKRLLAHELAHAVQQKHGQEINRWSIAGDTATSDRNSDTLGRLAIAAGGRFRDWKCIRPLSMFAARLAPPPSDFQSRYERYVNKGDTFDISNITATTGKNLRVHMFSGRLDAGVAAHFYPGMVASPAGDIDIDIDSAASDGSTSTPISNLVVMGHAGGRSMWGGAAVNFVPGSLDSEQPPQRHALAEIGNFPRRCWFTRNASTRAVGCNSSTFATDFAATYLRRGASVTATTAAVSPFCTAPLSTPPAAPGLPRGCTAYDQLAFTATSVAGSRVLDGPFSTRRNFHGSAFWNTTRGRL